MRFFAQSLALRVTFAFSFLIHFSNGQFELDTNAGDNNVPKIEQEAPPARELWVETSKGNNITLTCPKLPGSPPAVMELHEPIKTNPGLERKTVISTSGQLSLNNINYSDAKTYYCTYFTDAARLPTAKIHLNVYDVFSYVPLLRSRRSPAAHKVHHARKTHDSHGHEHAQEHKHSHAQEHENSQAQEHKHSHAQEHEHSQTHPHKHSHAQEHEHSQAQEHKHSHAQEHEHSQTHPHKHSHAQEHEHSQAQEHKHSHAQEHEHSQAQEPKNSHAHDHAEGIKDSTDHGTHGKVDCKDKEKIPPATALSDKNNTHVAKEEHNHEAAIAGQDEELDANENYDDDPSSIPVFEPPSPPDIDQLSDSSVQLKWTSGSLRDKGVKGYKIEYLKGNETKVFGGLHGWHVVANRIKPKFRIFKVNNLEPEKMYRFRIANIYAGNKYIYGQASGWVKMQHWS